MTAVQTAADTILEVNNLKTYIFTRAATVKAVDGVSFDLKKGRRSASWANRVVARQ